MTLNPTPPVPELLVRTRLLTIGILCCAQMEVLIMSRGGFSISAAHRGLPRRAMFLDYVQSEESTCVIMSRRV